MMLWKWLFLFVALVLLHGATALSQTQIPSRITESFDLNDLSQDEGKVAGIVRRFTADRGGMNRFHSAPYSPVRRSRFKQFYTEWLDVLRQLNFDSLTQQEKVDYVLFKVQLEYELRQLDIEEKRFAEMETLLPFALSLIELEDSRRLLLPVDPPKIAELLTGLNKKIQDTKKSLDAALRSETKTKPVSIKKAVANRAVDAVASLRTMLKNWYGFHTGYDPNFTWWVGEPYKSIDASLQEYGTFLSEKIVGVRADDNTTIVGDPIGRDALMVELASELIAYTPEELIALARKEMQWCEQEMVKASRELGYGDDWHKALEHVKKTYVEPGKQPELVRELAHEAIEFVEQNNLVTVPTLANQVWRMEMMSPERQLIAPFFLGGEVVQVAYPTNTMSHEAKMMSLRGNNPHFSRAVVHHELIPGHHLQGFMNARYRTYRNAFSTPFWTEGWALYWELLLWDMNFPKTPEDRIGMLFWRMHRGARIIFSLSFHLEQMTPQECIDMLVNKVGHEYENAAAEVRRSFSGQYGPLYQCAYLLGGLQFRSLQRELVESGKLTNRQSKYAH